MDRGTLEPWEVKNEAGKNGVRNSTGWESIEEGVSLITALSTDTHKGWWLLSYLNIGEAANPGLEGRRGIIVWSANVTSLSRRWQSMVSWEPDVMVVQETRLGNEAQRIMGMRIAQDGRVPLFGNPMPLKQKRDKDGQPRGETIWDAQQGGLATIARPDILAHRVDVPDSFYHLVETRRMEHVFVPCYKGDWGFHILNVYAMASAETEEVRTTANRRVYAEVIRYTKVLGNVPIFILGDFNPTIKGGLELEALRKKGG